jgi:hypothetical protein
MRSKRLRVLVALALASLPFAPLVQAAGANVDLAAGVRHVEEGDFEAAIPVLDRAVQTLSKQKGVSKELAHAYLYLAIANLGMSQEASAKARLLDALANDRELSLSPDEYPPKVIKLFDEVRREAGMATTPAARPKPAVAAQPKKEGGRSKLPYILGGVVVAGAGVALATGALGGGNAAPAAGQIVIEPPGTVPIVAVSEMRFISQGASDPDGDPLNYWWDFGDDAGENGQMVIHTYQRPGAFTVSLVVSDGKAESIVTAPLMVRDVGGMWRGTVGGGTFTLNLTQSGMNISGTFRDDTGEASVTGALIRPRNIELTIRKGSVPLVLPGEVAPDANTIVGNSLGRPFTITRQ